MTFRPEYMDWLDEIEAVCSEYNFAVLSDIQSAWYTAKYDYDTGEEHASPESHDDLQYCAEQASQALDDLKDALKKVKREV